MTTNDEERKRLKRLHEIYDDGHSCEGECGCDVCFLLRTIERQEKEIGELEDETCDYEMNERDREEQP